MPRRVVLVQGGHGAASRGPPRDGAGHGRLRRAPGARRRGAQLRGVLPPAAGRGGGAAARRARRARRAQPRRMQRRARRREVPGQGRRGRVRGRVHAGRRPLHGRRDHRRGTSILYTRIHQRYTGSRARRRSGR